MKTETNCTIRKQAGIGCCVCDGWWNAGWDSRQLSGLPWSPERQALILSDSRVSVYRSLETRHLDST